MLTSALLLAACSGRNGTFYAGEPLVPNAPFAQSPIHHVVIIVQENRSFDNLFYNFPGADSATSGVNSHGATVALQPHTLEGGGGDPGHFHTSFQTAFENGVMQRFNLEGLWGFVGSTYSQLASDSNLVYSYVPQSEIQPYWTLAQRYTLADRMFQSNGGPSYPAHQYLIAAQSGGASEVPTIGPWGCDAPANSTVALIDSNGNDVEPGVFPCFNYATIGDELDAAHIPWRYYTPALDTTAGLFSAYDAIRHVRYGADWTNDVISPETQVLTDIASGQLASVTWVIPSFPNSDHPLAQSNTGPAWVSAVVNAIGSSPEWNDTAILILWDDWGGWYDHVVPPQLDAMGLGFRVPLIVVSPYAKHGYVSHQQHEEASIIKFIEDNFALPSLNQADARADDLLDCFDFTQAPQPFVRIHAARSGADFLRERHVAGPNDPI